MGLSFNQPNLLTVQQFAALAGKSVDTITRYIHEQRINAFKFKSVWAISKDEWERTRSYFESNIKPPRRS